MPTPPGDNSFFKDNSYQYDDAVSWTQGRHNWKFGLVYRRQGFNATYNSNAAPDFGFDNALTSAGNLADGSPIDPNSGSGAASFFLGAASNGTIGGGQNAAMRVHGWGMQNLPGQSNPGESRSGRLARRLRVSGNRSGQRWPMLPDEPVLGSVGAAPRHGLPD